MFAKGGVSVYDVVTDTWSDPCCTENRGWLSETPVWTGSVAVLVGSAEPDVGGATFAPPA